MKTIGTTLVLLACSVLLAQEAYFPKNTLGQHPGIPCSHQLKVLSEPSLLQMAKNQKLHSYRFIWMRTFHAPVVVRLEVRSDNTGDLVVKVGNGAAGYSDTVTGVSAESSRMLTQEQTEGFLALVKRVGFWSVPARSKEFGPDGSHWIIEGIKGGNYHVVDRWSPSKASTPDETAVRELGTALAIKLAGLEIEEDQIY